jgi:hypothetical protein
MFSSCPAQPVEDDLEQVPGSGIPFVRLEASQVADEEDDVPGVDVGADGPFGLTGIEEQGQRFADRAQAVRARACDTPASTAAGFVRTELTVLFDDYGYRELATRVVSGKHLLAPA